MSGAGEGRPREGDGGSWTAGPRGGRRGRRAWGPGLVALPRALGTPNLLGPSEAGAPGQLEGFGGRFGCAAAGASGGPSAHVTLF